MKQYFMLILSIGLLLFSGCSKRQEIPLKHVHILAALKTAIAIESPKQINVCRQEIQSEKQNKTISSSFDEELQKVLQYADKKEWKQAEKEILELQKRYIVDSSTIENHHEH